MGVGLGSIEQLEDCYIDMPRLIRLTRSEPELWLLGMKPQSRSTLLALRNQFSPSVWVGDDRIHPFSSPSVMTVSLSLSHAPRGSRGCPARIPPSLISFLHLPIYACMRSCMSSGNALLESSPFMRSKN